VSISFLVTHHLLSSILQRLYRDLHGVSLDDAFTVNSSVLSPVVIKSIERGTSGQAPSPSSQKFQTPVISVRLLMSPLPQLYIVFILITTPIVSAPSPHDAAVLVFYPAMRRIISLSHLSTRRPYLRAACPRLHHTSETITVSRNGCHHPMELISVVVNQCYPCAAYHTGTRSRR
jgi:hypothetical protein